MNDLDLLRRDALKLGVGLITINGVGIAQTSSTDWKPAVLDPHQLSTVEVLEELIIPTTDTPGAKTALVHRYIDLFLDAGADADRKAFLDGLHWLDGYSLKKHEQPFFKLTEAQQIAILTTLDRQTEVGVDEGTRFFRQAKMMVSRIYYNTKIGYDELNKGGRVPATYGCKA